MSVDKFNIDITQQQSALGVEVNDGLLSDASGCQYVCRLPSAA